MRAYMCQHEGGPIWDGLVVEVETFGQQACIASHPPVP